MHPTRGRGLVPAITALGLTIFVVSCTQEPPLEPIFDDLVTVPQTTPPADAAPPYDVGACKSCLAATCVPEQMRCFQQPGCVTILNCAGALNCNQECINKCWFKQVGFGRREYQAVTTCEFEASCGACRDVCGASPLCVLRSDAPANATPPPAPYTCGRCMSERCDAVTKKCAPGTPCAEYYACTTPCLEPRQKCVDDCGVKFAQGKADGEALAACATTDCKAQCVY